MATRIVPSNSALLTDVYTSPLRARRGAAQRERWAALFVETEEA